MPVKGSEVGRQRPLGRVPSGVLVWAPSGKRTSCDAQKSDGSASDAQKSDGSASDAQK